jgi:hypothetical protein
MRRRDFLYVVGGLASLKVYGKYGSVFLGAEDQNTKMVGMYIHSIWPYKHPYSARTWTIDDYRGYADGLKTLGFDTLILKPLVEIMPEPLPPSDRAHLDKIRNVVDMLHNEFEMRVFLNLNLNVVANENAIKFPFPKRHYFSCDSFVDPEDRKAVERMMDWREKLLRPLAKIDGISIIDSDVGGYPGSTNEQFVHLFGEYRKMLDRLRPGIQLVYWMHVGWEAYSKYYATGKFEWGTPAEAVDVLTRLKKLDPKPWGIAVHTVSPEPSGADMKLAEKMGLASNAIAFNYGAIESEPSIPMTNFGGESAFKAGLARAPGGVAGNAQTHCVQLPNTFAFARGATGKPEPTERDYIEFADDLISGQGETIVRAWQALGGDNPRAMQEMAKRLGALDKKVLTTGGLKGLLVESPQRFISDLVLQLRLRAAFKELVGASDKNQDIRDPFRVFFAATMAWQERHGYESYWDWPKMKETLEKLNSPALNAVFTKPVLHSPEAGETPFEQVVDHDRKIETETLHLIEAMRETIKHLNWQRPES